jgi:adenosylcobinamide-phosphate synthase
MWGYRTERWRALGRVPARLDDALAWLPARLSALLLLAAAGILGYAPLTRREWRVVARDAKTMESPNAGWPMAAVAHALAAPMGGPAVYFGAVKRKPVLGPDNGASWDRRRLQDLHRLLAVAGALAALLLLPLGALLRGLLF